MLPFSQWPKSNVLCVFYTSILVSGMSKLFLMLAHFVHIDLLMTPNLHRLVNDTKPPYTHKYTQQFLYCRENKYGCMFLKYTHIYETQTHTRAFKVQNLKSSKRFNQSRLDFLPELGYVYICYSILKPSSCVLSCTPSHMITFVRLVW